MTPTEFWYGDMGLLQAYQTAYRRKVSYEGWLHGQYVFEALSKSIYNSFGRKKEADAVEQYSMWKDPTETKKVEKVTKENIEDKFRQQQIDQNAWLSALLHK